MSETSPLEVHVLASGSKGNCTVIKKGNSVILHDVGISCRRIVLIFLYILSKARGVKSKIS